MGSSVPPHSKPVGAHDALVVLPVHTAINMMYVTPSSWWAAHLSAPLWQSHLHLLVLSEGVSLPCRHAAASDTELPAG